MSRENVEIAQEAFEHFLRTGEQQWDAIDPDVEVYDHDIPDAGTYRGHEGYANWLADWGEAWGRLQHWRPSGGSTEETRSSSSSS